MVTDEQMRILMSHYQKDNNLTIAGIDEAVRDAQDGDNTMSLYPDVKDPEVTEVQLLYYADPAELDNKYLQPVYALTGPDTYIYVPAIKQ